jgi:glycosyltransferase involved in cell wall biosynthesis
MISRLTDRPECMTRYLNGELSRLVAGNREGYSHVFCDNFVTAASLFWPENLLGRASDCSKVLVSHNVESRVLAEQASLEREGLHLLKRRRLARDAALLEKAEAQYLPLFDRVLSVSERETKEMRARFGCGSNVTTLPFFLEPKECRPHPAGKRTLLFAGSLWWLPNRDALSWFFDHCWESILRAVPDADIVLAGNDKTGFAGDLAARYPNVRATGFVEDISPYFRDAALFVLPMRIGTGIKVKLFEAMAYGLPVVTTAKGVEGVMNLVPGENVRVADEPEDFVRAVCSLIENQEEGRQMAALNFRYLKQQETKLDSMLDSLFQ